MAEENRQTTAEVNQTVTVQVVKSRTHVRNQHSNRNYSLLRAGKETIIRNYNGLKTIMQRNYRRFSY